MYSSTTTTKELSISLLCLRIFSFEQIKILFCGDETLKNALLQCKCLYSTLIKTDNYFRTNCCLVINLKQNRFEIK